MTLEEKHLQAIVIASKPVNIAGTVLTHADYQDAAKECTRITLQHSIDVLKEFSGDYEWNAYDFESRISELQKQLSDLNK